MLGVGLVMSKRLRYWHHDFILTEDEDCEMTKRFHRQMQFCFVANIDSYDSDPSRGACSDVGNDSPNWDKLIEGYQKQHTLFP